jgi:hypothetical protein
MYTCYAAGRRRSGRPAPGTLSDTSLLLLDRCRARSSCYTGITTLRRAARRGARADVHLSHMGGARAAGGGPAMALLGVWAAIRRREGWPPGLQAPSN